MPSLTQDEISKYWDIFQGQNPQNGLVSGSSMFTLLKNSQLDDQKLAKVWDLADIDGDGNMDFDEFCVAMRLVFDALHGNSQVPDTLPDWLVPASKKHLVTASQALSGKPHDQGRSRSEDDDDLGLSSDFNWYVSPADRNSYLSVYTANADPRGKISFLALTELYETLDIPQTDISSAWNLVNPRSDERIDREQCIVFLHILNNRSKGVRVPRSVPASLRATFGKEEPSYDLNGHQAQIKRPTAPAKSSTFAEGYLSRLGLGGRSNYATQGTDFSATKDTDWEEVRLKRELADLENLIEKVEAQKKDPARGSGSNSNSSLVRRELQLLLEYKEQHLQAAKSGSTAGSTADLSQTKLEVDMIAEQVEALKEHLRSRESQLESLKNEIAAI